MLKLRYYQKKAVDDFFGYTLNNWGKHPIIVIPTGGGKSLVLAYIIKKIYKSSDTRILMLTHQKELIKQNAEELIKNFDNEKNLDTGIYSSGLKKRETKNRIIFAGIQSIYKKAWELGWFDIILIDECHLIPHKNEGMYRTFLHEMYKINKNIVIGGLSATPYRLKDGLLCEGKNKLFNDICHETTIMELINPNHIKNLDKKQYLCNLISKNAQNKVDLKNVHIRAGEYISKELEIAFKKNDLILKTIKEILEFTHDRKKILIFTSGISHCEEVLNKMLQLNLNAKCVHSQQEEEINQKNINDFKNSKIKYLINVKTLTTGFNEKAIDTIILLMSTQSPGLYSQIVGRGLRLHPEKKNCLILDFGRNIERLGPIDKIQIKKNKKTQKKEVVFVPQKECHECKILLHLSVMECPECGYIFPTKARHDETASDADILSKWKKPEEINVLEVRYERHQKAGKKDSLRVDYYINFYQKYSEWIFVEHEGFLKEKAKKWLKMMTNCDIDTIEKALKFSNNFRKPKKIIVNKNNKYPKIVGYKF